MEASQNVFFSAASCEKDIIFASMTKIGHMTRLVRTLQVLQPNNYTPLFPMCNIPVCTFLKTFITFRSTLPHGLCYSHLGDGVRNGVIPIMQWGIISGCYKVKSIGQWGKILVMAMGFVDHLGH